MIAIYSITGKYLSIYNRCGTCVVTIDSPFDMKEIASKFNIKDCDIHLTF